MKKARLTLSLFLAVIILDQVTKFLILESFHLYESVEVIKGFFNLVHVRNRGIAFGIMNRSGNEYIYYLLIAATIGAMVLILLWLIKLKADDKKLIVGLSLIMGGACGNLIDRIARHEVIDFLDLYIGPYHWPAFNVADSAITLGTFWAAINILLAQRSKTS